MSACSLLANGRDSTVEEFRKGWLEVNSEKLSDPFSSSIWSSLFFSEDYGCPFPTPSTLFPLLYSTSYNKEASTFNIFGEKM